MMKIADNKKAYHDYFILEKIEVGIVLTGTEMKSIRKRRLNLKDSYGTVVKGEIFLEGVHISPFEEGNRFNHEPLRTRKLLLHKRQISRLIGKIKEEGLTLVPLSFYFNERGKVKVSLGLAKGKKLYDKRHVLAKKESDRQIERALKEKIIND
ncbi:SsrA-binding protein [endosymbiont 'TC1' of Trimyema compressum]|uniref:SsrA-binding protein SmpB n=1 Tax=endosymbiont 'TC1' of Trimyema compressum TaxID=243899 RepID=UPI0007F0ACF2|nr:SsrA-binding protein [endosymbiont 'TC1' of Trimyema compressum]